MNPVLFLFLLFLRPSIEVRFSDDLPKCCDLDETVARTGDSYNCTGDSTRRRQISTRNLSALKTETAGECFDVLDDAFVKIDIKTGVSEIYDGDFFPKCCPMNSVYDSELHSCIESSKYPDFINETFVKVGLPHCKIIHDFEISPALYRYASGNLDKNSFCLDRNERGAFVLRRCQEGYDICRKMRCVKKCCPDGQSFVNSSKCVDTYSHGVNVSSLERFIEGSPNNYAIIHNRTCKQIYKMPSDANITVHKNGSFTELIDKTYKTEDVADANSYCIEHFSRKATSGYYFFHCFSESEELTKFDFSKWPLMLSCVFLLITIVVYVVIKEYKKMFGKILIHYCLASFILFALLLWNNLVENISSTNCQIISYVLILCALAQCTWANIMCFEIWCTFGTTKLYIGADHKEIEFRKFLTYSLYAWGVPLLLTLIIILFSQWKILPDAIQPYLAEEKCFFIEKQGNYAKYLFYSAPQLVIQMINVVFFIKTIAYCMKVKNEINKINDATKTYSARKYQHDKARLLLILKLSIVMGISYIFEIITSFFNMSDLGVGAKYVEIVLDTYNELQGVFIFIIFICKRKVIFGCLQKFNIHIRRSQNSSSTRTQSTLTLNGNWFYFPLKYSTKQNPF
ncbi:unnamed protein product [Phyllotreta striolata]|uniref:Uncharacterized protein n=1 Tax=Phyllotreta striolata TaxID=444603 RepID=A0A9N9THH5_PHYSR|nr:unnamed protein product [Phyllotreta striolata]